MKHFPLLALLLFFVKVSGQPADYRVGETVAGTLAAKQFAFFTGGATDYRTLHPSIVHTENVSGVAAYYVVAFPGTRGYVIVSGSKAAPPVLATLMLDSFDTARIPPPVKSYLGVRARNIVKTLNGDPGRLVEAVAGHRDEWRFAESVLFSETDAGTATTLQYDSIAPLLHTKWGQRYPYNAHCPVLVSGLTPAGCGPVAMAQIMRYHEYPEVYDWSQMGESHDTYNFELANIISDCGEAAGTNYSYLGSSTEPWEMDDAMQSVFGYPTAKYKDIPNAGRKGGFEYTIKRNLEDGFPVIIHGYEEYNIFDWHIFVMDGYKGLPNGWMGLFHINWGWQGSYDGWFQLEDCNPPGENGPYNYNQGIVYRISPPAHVAIASPQPSEAVPSSTPVAIAWQSLYRAGDMDSAMIVIYQANQANTLSGQSALNYDTIRGIVNNPGQNVYMHTFDNPHVSLADTADAWVQVILFGDYGDNAHYRFFSEPVPFGVYHGEFMTFTSPTAGSVWQANMDHTISWNFNTNTSPQFKVKYKKVSGPVSANNSGTVVLQTAANSFNWRIPPTLQGTYYLEGYKLGFPEIMVFSQHFTIGPAPTLTVTQPTVNALYQPGTLLPIRWTSDLPENVRIILQRWDNWGVIDTTVIAASTVNDGAYDWVIPEDLDEGIFYSVVVNGVNNSQVSGAVFYFTIRQAIRVTNPVAGAEWEIGKTYYIEWVDNIPEDVAIKLYQGTTFVGTLAGNAYSDGSFQFTVPSTLTPAINYRFRIHMQGNESIEDYSDFFSIVPTRIINITDPAPNAVWQKGSSYAINWTTNVPNGFKIELLDTRFQPHTVIPIHNFNYPGYTWTVPANLAPHSLYKIRVTSVQYPEIADSSDFFTIESAPYINVTQPVAASNWPTATSQSITWDDNLSGNVNIYLYRRYATPGFIATLASNVVSSGNWAWTLAPTLTPATDYYVIVRSVDFPTVQGVSADFTISQGSFVTVTAPATGTQWEAGTSNKIKWNDNITENVRIILRKPSMGIQDTIVHSTPSTGIYMWAIPINTMPATNYNILIQSLTNPLISDLSDPFEIFSSFGFFITVTNPTSDSVWKIGTSHTITWDDNVYGAVTVDLYKNNAFLQTIGSTLTGSINWTVPTTFVPPGNDYKVKVTWNNNSAYHDYSQVFTIAPADFIDYLAPGGFRMNDTVNITWNDNIPENVKLELLHADTLYSVICPSTESDGIYTWGVPSNLPAEQWYKIRISRVGGAPLSDLSVPVPIYYPYYIQVTTPEEGDVLFKGSSYAIQWNHNLINNEYFRFCLYKGADSVANIIGITVMGYFLWNINILFDELEPGNDYRIKVSCIDRPQVYDFSDPFSIVDCNSLSLSIGNDTSVVVGTPVTLAASDGFDSYFWSPFQGGGRVLNLGPTWFPVPDTVMVGCVASYAGGCVKHDTLMLYITAPTCTADATFSYDVFRDEVVCNRYTFTLAGDSLLRYRYLWDFGDVTTLDTTALVTDHTFPGPGSYLVTCTAYDPVFPGCQQVESATIVIHPAPVIDFQYSIAADTATFLPLISGPGHYAYTWLVDSLPAVNILHDSLAGDTLRVVFPANRNYQVCLEVYDTVNPSCLFTHCETVEVTTIPPCRSTTCYFGIRPLSGYGSGIRNAFRFTGGVNPELTCSQVSWNLGDGTPPFSGTLSFDHTFAPGTYLVTMKVTNCDACVFIHSDTVFAYPQLDPALPPSAQGCDSVLLSPDPSYAHYIWQDSTQNITYTAHAPGSYWVTALDGHGYHKTDSVDVQVAPSYTVSLAPFPVLCSDGISYQLTGGTPAGGIYLGNHIAGSIFSITQSGAGFFPVNYYFPDNLGCSDTATGVIEVEPVFSGNGYHQNITYTGQHYFTGDSVLTGSQVTVSQPQGPVIFAAGSLTTLKGQQLVALRPGTQLMPGCSFRALTGPLSCLTGSDALVSKAATLPIPGDPVEILQLTPNPTSTDAVLTIRGGNFDGMMMTIYNSHGIPVSDNRMLSGTSAIIRAQDLRPGIYFIRVTGTGVRYLVKMIRV